MKLLYNQSTATLHSYPRQDDEPVVGLDPEYLELVVIQAERPSYDPATRRLEPTETIDTQARTVTRGWELIELPSPAPAPDWATFKSTALNSTTLNAIVAEAFQAAPVAAASLAPALLRAENHGAADFAAAWSAICAVVPVAPEVIEGFQQVATGCNLPDEFLAVLGPSAPALVRARAANGAFIADDPATPDVDEAWVTP